MDAHAFDPVDLADRQHQLALARQSQAFTLQCARGAQRHRVEHFAGSFRRGNPGIAGDQHLGAVDIVLGDRDRASGIIDGVSDPARLERFDHLGALAIGKAAVEQARRAC
jgi:hypothetical protein